MIKHKKLFVSANLVLLIGLILCGISFCISGLDLFQNPEIYEIINEAAIKDAKEIYVNALNSRVIIEPSQDDSVNISYTKTDMQNYSLENVDGKISLDHTSVPEGWHTFLNVGLWNLDFGKRTVKISVPHNSDIDFNIRTTNGDIKISDIIDSNPQGIVKVSVANGDIVVRNVSVGKIDVSSTNGDSLIKNVEVLTSLKATIVNGDISTTLIGRWHDFIHKIKVTNGSDSSSALTPVESLEPYKNIPLEINVTNGDSLVSFTK